MPKDYRDDDRHKRRRRSSSRERKKRNRDSDEERRRRSRERDEKRRRRSPRTPDKKKSRRSPTEKREMKDVPLYERKRLLSISSTSSEDEKQFDEKMEALRKEKSEKRKAEKQKMKEKETVEEKRIRRLAKKIKKEESRKLESISGAVAYNNLNNPFNDTNLTDPFVWNKKLEKEGLTCLSKRQLEEIHAEKVRRNIRETEVLRRNREARQAAKDDMEMIAREREKQMCGDYTLIEYKFQVQQAKERTKIRIKENRAKPIDLLVRYSVFGASKEEEDYGDFELVDPLTYIKNLSIDDFEDLLADVKTYKKIATYKDDAFWDDIRVICEGELEKLKDIRKRKEMDEAVHSSVRNDVLNKFKGKNYQQLIETERQIRETIAKNPGNGFFEAVLDQLLPYMAKQRIKERHREKMALKLQKIREEQAREMDEHQKQFSDVKPVIKVQEKSEEKLTFDDAIEVTPEDKIAIQKQLIKSIQFTLEELLELDDEKQEQQWSTLNDAQLEVFAAKNYELGRYSPTLDSTAMPGIEVIDENEDKKQLEAQRLRNRIGAPDPMTTEEANLMKCFKQATTQDEEDFAEEEKIEKQTFLWSDKYRPRKPRYFNRVHTGFDWNKYNQTHYDLDNPPPKVVQGYRFNIFYPDLLDVTQTPQYTIIECDDSDFAILRFKAGPPYEDIAFKIVNREWEINHKHGFKNQFKDGVFQLWFFFKRYRYRR